MGARAQVLVKNGSEEVYLYTHWGATSIVDDVRRALQSEAGRSRLDDSEYLARIIFDVMKDGESDGATGFGIGVAEHGDIEKLVTVDTFNHTVTVKDIYDSHNSYTVSTADFIAGNKPQPSNGDLVGSTGNDETDKILEKIANEQGVSISVKVAK